MTPHRRTLAAANTPMSRAARPEVLARGRIPGGFTVLLERHQCPSNPAYRSVGIVTGAAV